jgi:hypothetical protein
MPDLVLRQPVKNDDRQRQEENEEADLITSLLWCQEAVSPPVAVGQNRVAMAAMDGPRASMAAATGAATEEEEDTRRDTQAARVAPAMGSSPMFIKFRETSTSSP